MVEPCDTKSLVLCKSCLESKEPELHTSPSRANDALKGYGSSFFIYCNNLLFAVESCESKMSIQVSCSVIFSDWGEGKMNKQHLENDFLICNVDYELYIPLPYGCLCRILQALTCIAFFGYI